MYHVLIEEVKIVGGKEQKQVLAEYDINDKEYIIQYFVKPYVDKRPIYIDGSLVDFTEVNKFKVCFSDKESDSLYENYRAARRSPGIMSFTYKYGMFSDKNYFKDITRTLLIENDFYK